MVKRILALLFVCLAAVGDYGCGASGKQATASEKTAPIENNPSLRDAQSAEAAGQSLSGRQKRMLKDAREDGVVE